jgi:hypothetical protein
MTSFANVGGSKVLNVKKSLIYEPRRVGNVDGYDFPAGCDHRYILAIAYLTMSTLLRHTNCTTVYTCS